MADMKEYLSCSEELGTVHIYEDVLAVTAAAATLEVSGVGGLAANLGDDLVEMLAGRKNLSKGVRILMEDQKVGVDLSLLVKYGNNIQEIAAAVQEAVAVAIENASGFQVSYVNVHVVGVTMPPAPKPKQA